MKFSVMVCAKSKNQLLQLCTARTSGLMRYSVRPFRCTTQMVTNRQTLYDSVVLTEDIGVKRG